MPPLDLDKITVRRGSSYPEPYATMMAGRSSLALGKTGGLTQFGVNLVTLEPGALSSMRHWHHHEDEFVMVTEGECTLVQDEGDFVMRAGDCVAFPAGVANGHHFINRGDKVARFVVVGTRLPHEVAEYSDIDMMVALEGERTVFTHKDGTPFGSRAKGERE